MASVHPPLGLKYTLTDGKEAFGAASSGIERSKSGRRNLKKSGFIDGEGSGKNTKEL